jgi:uncharacterized protein (TIGR03435 family)
MRPVLSVVVVVLLLSTQPPRAQQPAGADATTQTTPEWQKAAGDHMSFEVASVRVDTGEFKPPSFPLSADDSFTDTGGLFRADFPLVVYIQFAYKLALTREQTNAVLDKLPGWARSDRFLIEARADGHPTKDQYRLMMQSLLAERFGLKLHFEARQVPVFEMVLAKPGKLGPNLKPHSDGPPCEGSSFETAKSEAEANVFPRMCGAFAARDLPDGSVLVASRNTTMELIAGMTGPGFNVGRPVLDKTGLTGRYDFSLQYSVAATRAASSASADATVPSGTPFQQAFQEQLGLKLVPSKAVVRLPVIDAVQRPAEN